MASRVQAQCAESGFQRFAHPRGRSRSACAVEFEHHFRPAGPVAYPLAQRMEEQSFDVGEVAGRT